MSMRSGSQRDLSLGLFNTMLLVESSNGCCNAVCSCASPPLEVSQLEQLQRPPLGFPVNWNDTHGRLEGRLS
jgi:hypothetical protein